MKRQNILIALIIFSITLSSTYSQRIFRPIDPNNSTYRYGKSAYSGPPFLYFSTYSHRYWIASSLYNSHLSYVDAAFTSWNNAGPVQFSRYSSGLTITADAQDYSSMGPAWSYPSWNASTLELTPESGSIILNSSSNVTWNHFSQNLNAIPHILDVQSMVVHEAGHIHGLAHPLTDSYTHNATAPTMAGGDNAYFDNTLDVRSLETEDIYGTRFLQLRVPTLYSDLQSTLNKAAEIGIGYVYIVSNYTLVGNISVPSGVTLTIKSGTNVNLTSSHYSILSTGGTIIVESGATISNLRATLTCYDALRGLCGTIQAAVNAVIDNDYGNTYLLQMPNGTFSETVNISNKFGLIFNGNGSTTTTINGNVNISNCGSCSFGNFTANALSLSGCVLPHLGSINLDIGAVNPSLYAYNCTNFYYTGGFVSDRYAYIYGIGFNLYQSSTSTIDGSAYTLFYHNVRGIYANGSTVNVDFVYFCNNTYDLATSGGATINANYCYFPGGVPHTQGSNIYTGSPQISNCAGLPKSSFSLSKSIVDTSDASSDEFMQIDMNNFDLARKVRADISEKKEFDKEKYRNDYLSLVNSYNGFIKKHPGSEYSKTALISIVHIYKLLGDYEGMKAFLQEIIADKKLIHESGWAKRFMLEYYRYNKDFTTAFATAEEIMKERADDKDLLCNVLFAEGLLYAHDLNNPESAAACFSNIVNNYSDNSLVEFAENELEMLGIKSKEIPKENQAIESVEFSAGNYPNPFNPSTTISYSLPEEGRVQIKVFDALGREVRTLLDEVVGSGRHSIYWNGSNSASGIYFYSISFKGQTLYKKMILMK